MKVKVIKTDKNSWYKVGEVFTVTEDIGKPNHYVCIETGLCIDKNHVQKENEQNKVSTNSNNSNVIIVYINLEDIDENWFEDED